MTISSRRIGALSALGLVILLTSCASAPVLHIPVGTFDLARCASTSVIPVKDLHVRTPVECDLVGSTLTFPDGYQLTVPKRGVTVQEERSTFDSPKNPSYGAFNFGKYGIVAFRENRDRTGTEWWGTNAGLRRYEDAFGSEIR